MAKIAKTLFPTELTNKQASEVCGTKVLLEKLLENLVRVNGKE